MFGEINGVVLPGIAVKFVNNVARGESLVERGGSGVKTVIVLVAAVEIDL